MTDHQSAPVDEPAAAGETVSRSQARAERRAGRLAKQVRAFLREHGEGTEAHLGYLGERGVRIVLVGADGRWGDLVAPSDAVARRAVEQAGVTVRESLDGETAARIRTGRYEWSRMAGNQLSGVTGRP